MALQTFSVAALSDISGGKIAAQIDKLIEDCIADCNQRPGDKKPRQVGVKMAIAPVMIEATGQLEGIEVGFEMSIKTPSRISRIFSMGVKSAKGRLKAYFNTENDGDIRQMTLDEKEGRKLPPDDDE